MALADRARYAGYLTIVCGVFVSLILVVASAEAISLLPPEAFDYALSPLLVVIIYPVAFLVAPMISRRFPFKR
jgi:Na+-driven multidrug efflux pump